jgi:hypothetical protein
VILTPRRVRPSLGPVVVSLAAGIAVLLFGVLVNGCQINKLLGRPGVGGSEGPLLVTPAIVRDSALAGTTVERRSSIQVTNGGRWSATNDSLWIDVIPSAGVGARTVTVTLDPEGLKPGAHRGSVTLSGSETTDAVTVPVTFVIQQPVLRVDPKSVDRTVYSGNAKVSAVLTVSNRGTGPLVWTASNKSSWLDLETVAGVGEGQITLTMSSSGLKEGTYRDTVVVVAVGAVGSPVKIPVTFKRRRND